MIEHPNQIYTPVSISVGARLFTAEGETYNLETVVALRSIVTGKNHDDVRVTPASAMTDRTPLPVEPQAALLPIV